MNRREAVRWLGFGAAAHVAANYSLGQATRRATAGFDPDVELLLTAAPGEVAILPGAATQVWRFTGEVLRGPADSLQPIAGSYLGPTIRLRRGQRVRIRFANRLPESSIVHWHGLDVPFLMDGHPSLAVASGGEYLYEFEVTNRAGTYWYHPHPHMHTGPQVYRGLAGLLIVADDEESALGLPQGEHELVCVLQDRQFDAANQLVYLGGGMMDQMHGFLGNRMLVNGALRPTVAAATRAYRVRLLNGSNSRIYKLRWSDGTPMAIIGGDGGLLEAPVQQRSLTLAPGQRADLILDLSRHAVGAVVTLQTVAFPAASLGLTDDAMAAMMPASPSPNGVARSLLTVRVARRERVTWAIPARLSTFEPRWSEPVEGPVRRITLDFRRMQWLLAGRAFEMTAAAPDETVAAGSRQVWEIANIGGMMGSPMAHPIHVHGLQFRILSRTGGPPTATAAAIREGIIDAGWRDTVLVLPDETVRIQLQFTRHPGLYLYHCHILEHEDGGMMRNFRVS